MMRVGTRGFRVQTSDPAKPLVETRFALLGSLAHQRDSCLRCNFGRRAALFSKHAVGPLDEGDKNRWVSKLRAPLIKVRLRYASRTAACPAGVDLHLLVGHLFQGFAQRGPAH